MNSLKFEKGISMLNSSSLCGTQNIQWLKSLFIDYPSRYYRRYLAQGKPFQIKLWHRKFAVVVESRKVGEAFDVQWVFHRAKRELTLRDHQNYWMSIASHFFVLRTMLQTASGITPLEGGHIECWYMVARSRLNLVPRFSLLPVERPWLGLVTCLQESGRLQTNDLGEGRISVRFVSTKRRRRGQWKLCIWPCLKGHVFYSSRNPRTPNPLTAKA